MENGQGQLTTEEARSQVEAQLDLLSDEIEIAKDISNETENRLLSVLRECSPEEQPNGDNDSELVPLANRLHVLRTRMASVNRDCKERIRRIEL